MLQAGFYDVTMSMTHKAHCGLFLKSLLSWRNCAPSWLAGIELSKAFLKAIADKKFLCFLFPSDHTRKLFCSRSFGVPSLSSEPSLVTCTPDASTYNLCILQASILFGKLRCTQNRNPDTHNLSKYPKNDIRHLWQEAPLLKVRRILLFLSETVSTISSLRTYLNWNVRHSFFEVNIFLRIPCYNFLVRTIIIRLFFSAERSLLFLVIRKFLQIPLELIICCFC